MSFGPHFTLWILVAGLAACVENASAEVLTWEDCLRKTAQSNPEIQAARERLEAAERQLQAGYSPFLPEVSLVGTSERSGSESSEGSTRYRASMNATQNLFQGFRDMAAIDQAKAARDIAAAELDATLATVSSDLKSAFANFLYFQKLISFSELAVQRRQTNLKLVSFRFQSGRENRGSVLLSEANLAQARYDLTQATTGLVVSRVALARVLAVDHPDELAITGPIPVTESGEPIDISKIAATTPAFRQAAAQEQSAEARVKSARSTFLPSLGAFAGVTRSDNQWYPGNSQWSLGLSLSYPLFSGGRDYFALRSASAIFNATASQRENVKRELVADLQQAHTAYLNSIQKLEVDKAFVEAATVRAKIAREKYNNGLLDFNDWDIIEGDLINRQRTLLQSERDRVVAEAAWERSQGKAVFP